MTKEGLGFFECISCGATGAMNFHELCEEGCPVCTSHNINMYGDENVELD